MKSITGAGILFSVLLAGFGGAARAAAPAADKAGGPGNFVLVGWDGARRDRVMELLSSGQLPNLRELIGGGRLVLTDVTTGETQTKPGWAEMLTGYSALKLGISGNRNYKPIPAGYTIFERLQKAFGQGNIATIFLTGKINNLGARGPHEICINCISRDSVTRAKTHWWARKSVTTAKTRDGKPPAWVRRTGEPYFITKKHLDIYSSGLGAAQNVGERALAALEAHAKERFFAFFHFEEPDEQGHLYGENSEEYSEGLKTADRWLGEIVRKLRALGIYEKTTIYVATDHGFQEGGFEHFNAPKTFLAANSKQKLKDGDRKDITPSILEEFGIDLKEIDPPLDGRSLSAAAPSRPNILLVVLDTSRADHLSAYGYARHTTPNIDELARGGVLFRSAYSQTNWTLPSFASFLTGKYPRTLGMFEAGKELTGFDYADPKLGDSETTLPEALKKAGYRTAGFFTGRFNGPDYGFDQGFDLYRNYRNSSGRKEGPVRSFAAFLPEALKWMDENKDAPFFVLLHSSELHRPYRAPERFVKQYSGGYEGILASTWLSKDVLSAIRKDDKGWALSPDGPSADGVPSRPAGKSPPRDTVIRLDKADLDYIVARYDASLTYADTFIGELADWTRRSAPDNTIVVVLGDHGEGLGSHGGILHCTDPPRLYQELIHVPLVIAGHKKWLNSGTSVVGQPVELIDLMPTILDLAGAPHPPSGIQGKSLAGVIRGGSGEGTGRAVFAESLGYGLAVQSVMTGAWKLIRTARAGGGPPKTELYDLAADPSEEEDLSARNPGAVKELLARLDSWTADNEKQKKPPPARPVRVGYFHGGRTALMLRLYEAGGFAKRGLNVDFYAAPLRGTEYKLVPRSIEEFNEGGTDTVGKSKGTELIDAMLEGRFDLAMVGESSFISSLHAGKPIVAIAELGHDVKGQAGHVFLMRKGLRTEKPSDYFGKVLVSRRAGPGDAVFLREYLEHAGVNLETSALYLKSLPRTRKEKARLPRDKVLIAEDVFEDDMREGVKNGVVDGGYFHLMGVPKKLHAFDLVASMDDFTNPELSHALLVCTTDFLRANREELVTLLEVYIERVKHEHGLSYEERTRPRNKGLQMAMDLNGLNYPQYDLVPAVEAALLYEMEKLLEKHGFIGKKDVKIENYTDNSLVYDALKNLNLSAKDDYWRSKY